MKELHSYIDVLISRFLLTDLSNNPSFFYLGIVLQELKRKLYEKEIIPEMQGCVKQILVSCLKKLPQAENDVAHFNDVAIKLKALLSFPTFERSR